MRRSVYLSIAGLLFYFCAAFGCNAILGNDAHTLDACTPSATKCDGSGDVLVCADGQTFTKQTTCPNACVNGACAGVCKPGATQCSGATPETCDPTGAWQSGTCSAGLVCMGGSCVSGCFVGGSEYAPGTANPSNPCQSCQPSTSTSAWTNATDGMACGAGEVCTAGTCTSACFIGGAVYQASAPNPNNPCQSCQPAASTTAWSSIMDGTACGNGQVCAGGNCGTQCDIAGTVYPTSMVNPGNPCQSCQPGTSTSAWTNLSDGTACGSGEVCTAGACTAGCFIGGTVYATGAADPANACQSCQPGTSTTTWTNVSDGNGCGAGEVCTLGSCVAGCFVGGTVYPSGTANPGNTCQSCQPGVSTTAWSNVTDGASCGTGGICHTGACVSGCEVGGVYYAVDAPDPNNPCQSCQPGTSTSAFSNDSDGTGCGNGQFCGSGMCGTACDIGGTAYASGTLDPANACQSCQPGTSSSAWSDLADGTGCAAGQVCKGGSCVSECFISSTLYTSGTADPANACQSCQPATSTTAWSNIPNGSACAAQEVCDNGGCISGCFIGGTVYTASTANPSFICQSCQPDASTTAWTTDANGTVCGAGQVCEGGVCVHQVVFGYTGASQNFVVPAGVTQITVTALGASGASDCYGTAGGKGASAVATIPVTPGETLVLNVAGEGGPPTGSGTCATAGPGGFNGGAAGGTLGPGGDAGAGGGGASDVRRGGAALGNRVVIAGGGGGGGGGPGGGPGGNGGASGTAGGTGANLSGQTGGGGGGGGTAAAGGTAGALGSYGGAGVAGGSAVGGAGGTSTSYFSGGGGGGGNYGGGGGGGGYAAGGGGGGSSYVEATGAGVTITAGVQAGNGQITINY